MTEPDGATLDVLIGGKVELVRRQRGLSRLEVARMTGHSKRWLGQLEAEGRGATRLENLIALARALRVADLSSLVGHQFTATALETPQHPSVPEVRKALTIELLDPAPGGTPCTAASLERRIIDAWDTWHTSRRQHTELGLLLPSLLRDATTLARTASGTQASRANSIAARVHLLGQRYAYGVRAMDLAAQFTDRALLAAVASGNSYLVALAGWGAAMTSLTAQRPQEAEDTALAALRHIAHPKNDDEKSLRGALLLFAAMGAAGERRTDDAWRHWTEADDIADEIRDHREVQTMFSSTNVRIYEVAVNVEIGRSSAAVAAATRLDPAQMKSTNRLAQYYIDLAKGYLQEGDRAAASGAILESAEASEETIAFSPEGRHAVRRIIRETRTVEEGIALLAERLGLR
ncbi:helix-turn-helix transcriptional regulator [Streptomyces sp. NPDC051572]|uniref:helix-turn-helix domain-containing protein n=1 Tax=Streptomyces sp. NPDC051572 TaxID=3155802 RepID=UPI00344B30FA